MTTAQDGWWSERQTEGDAGLVWRIGPLTLWVYRLGDEWQVSHQEDRSAEDPTGWSVETIDEAPAEIETVARFAAGKAGGALRLLPRPADRSVVVRPRSPLHVLAGEEARFYVAAPVWVEVFAGSPPRRLCEMPSRRPTDTWFGPNTLDGEVAYSLKTHARAQLAHVPPAAYRAVTPVLIRNHGSDPLPLDRMNLPVPYLSIYRCERGKLWTETVTLLRTDDHEMATFEVASGPPDEASGAERLGEAREVSAGNPLVRAFGRLLRPFHQED